MSCASGKSLHESGAPVQISRLTLAGFSSKKILIFFGDRDNIKASESG